MRMRKLCVLLLFLLAVSIARAETSGTINFSFYNTTAPVTGLFAYTVDVCDTDATCLGYRCRIDFDGEVDDSDTGKPSGTCRQQTSPDCFHDSRFYARGTNVKNTNVTYYTCLTNETGRWSALKSCSSGEVFGADSTEAGNCTSSTSSSSSSGGGGGSSSNTTVTLKHSIRLVSGISDSEITQGESAVRYARFRNDGNLTLSNVTLELSGMDANWYGINPSIFSSVNSGKEDQFNVTFFIPKNAEVKGYTVNGAVKTHKSDVGATFSFTLKVLPSNETVETDLVPKYSQLSSYIQLLEQNISGLRAKGIDEGNITQLENLAESIKSKLAEANLSLEKKDYFSASTLLSDAQRLLDELNTMLASASPPAETKTDIILITAAAFVTIVIVFVLYLSWPTKRRL